MTKNKKKTISFIGRIVALLFTLATILFGGIVFYSSIIPDKYYILMMIILYSIAIVFLPLLSIKKIKSKIKIVISILSIIFIIIMVFISTYVIKTTGFLDKLMASRYKTETFHLIVSTDKEFKKIEDLDNCDIGSFSIETSPLLEFRNKIDEQISVSYITYNSVDEMVNALFDGRVCAIALEDAYIDTLEEEIEDFDIKIHSLYDYTIKTTIEESVIDVDVTKEPFNIYISGSDSYGTIESVSRSDVNMIASVNPKTNKILLTSIPRDYYVQLHGTTGYKDKLTHTGFYGVNMSISTIEDLLSIDINYYVKINFSGFVDFIDSIGQLDVYSLHNFTSTKASGGVYRFNKGYNTMNGVKALSFVRTRGKKTGIDDRDRGENQQAVIDAVIKKVSSAKNILLNYESILNSINGTIVTNMPIKNIKSLVKMQLDSMPNWEVSSYSLDGFDSSGPTYTFGEGKLWVMNPNQDTIDESKEKIEEIFNN